MKVIEEEYFHINNGGTTFSVVDDGQGPEVLVKTGHFGASSHEFRLKVSLEGLMTLSRMFADASQYKRFSIRHQLATVAMTEEERNTLGDEHLEK